MAWAKRAERAPASAPACEVGQPLHSKEVRDWLADQHLRPPPIQRGCLGQRARPRWVMPMMRLERAVVSFAHILSF